MKANVLLTPILMILVVLCPQIGRAQLSCVDIFSSRLEVRQGYQSGESVESLQESGQLQEALWLAEKLGQHDVVRQLRLEIEGNLSQASSLQWNPDGWLS